MPDCPDQNKTAREDWAVKKGLSVHNEDKEEEETEEDEEINFGEIKNIEIIQSDSILTIEINNLCVGNYIYYRVRKTGSLRDIYYYINRNVRNSNKENESKETIEIDVENLRDEDKLEAGGEYFAEASCVGDYRTSLKSDPFFWE